MLVPGAEEADVGRWEAFATCDSARAAVVRPSNISYCLLLVVAVVVVFVSPRTFSLWSVLLYLPAPLWQVGPVAIAQCFVQQAQVSGTLFCVGSPMDTHGAVLTPELQLPLSKPHIHKACFEEQTFEEHGHELSESSPAGFHAPIEATRQCSSRTYQLTCIHRVMRVQQGFADRSAASYAASSLPSTLALPCTCIASILEHFSLTLNCGCASLQNDGTSIAPVRQFSEGADVSTDNYTARGATLHCWTNFCFDLELQKSIILASGEQAEPRDNRHPQALPHPLDLTSPRSDYSW